MCLLVTQPEGTVFDDAFLQGVYKKNKDGLGVMYADNGKLHVAKCLPRNFHDFAQFYDKEIKGRHCAWHARMQTHGDVDYTNCHPYEVFSDAEGYPLYLMHNGVLHTNNKWDVKRSDTWHYIQRYLRTLLKSDPTLFMNPMFIEMIEDHIGQGNKFALLDSFGNLVTINESAFVDYNGAKLSNTYAWDTTGTEHDYSQGRTGLGWSNDFWPASYSSYKPPASLRMPSASNKFSDDYYYADDECDLFFESLEAAQFTKAYKCLTFSAVYRYVDTFDKDALNDLSDLILADAITEEEVLAEIRNPGSVLYQTEVENIEGEEHDFATHD